MTAEPRPLPRKFRLHVLAVLRRRQAGASWDRRLQLADRRDMFENSAVWRGGGRGVHVIHRPLTVSHPSAA